MKALAGTCVACAVLVTLFADCSQKATPARSLEAGCAFRPIDAGGSRAALCAGEHGGVLGVELATQGATVRFDLEPPPRSATGRPAVVTIDGVNDRWLAWSYHAADCTVLEIVDRRERRRCLRSGCVAATAFRLHRLPDAEHCEASVYVERGASRSLVRKDLCGEPVNLSQELWLPMTYGPERDTIDYGSASGEMP